jgi:hypothetical protein
VVKNCFYSSTKALSNYLKTLSSKKNEMPFTLSHNPMILCG